MKYLIVVMILAVATITGCSNSENVEATPTPAAKTECAEGCEKECCAEKDGEKKACPPDCTKECCAKDGEEKKACPPDCTKECCADKTK